MSQQPVPLGTLFQFIRNGMSVKQNSDAGGLPITRIETISDGTVNPQKVGFAGLGYPEATRWLLEPGDILFSHINSFEHVGKCAVYRGEPAELVHGMNLLCFRADKGKLDHEYAKHLLRSIGFRTRLERFINKAVNQASVSIGNLSAIPISLPPLDEQRRIATMLDKAEEVNAKRRAAVSLLDQLPKAIFLKMFGDPVTNPMGWPIVPVGEVTDCIVPGRDKPKSFSGTTPWVTTSDLLPLGRTNRSTNHVALSEAEIQLVRAKVIPRDSVILSCVGDLGVLSIAEVPMVINQQLHAFQCSHLLNPEFLMRSLSFQKTYMYSMASSTTLPYMNKSICNSIPTILPPVSLQNKFATRIDSIYRVRTTNNAAHLVLDVLLTSLQAEAFGEN